MGNPRLGGGVIRDWLGYDLENYRELVMLLRNVIFIFAPVVIGILSGIAANKHVSADVIKPVRRLVVLMWSITGFLAAAVVFDLILPG